MPGVIEVRRTLPVGDTVDELLLVILASNPADLRDQIVYVPLR